MTPRLPKRKTTLVLSIVGVLALVVGAGAVNALTTNRSQQISQRQLTGPVEVGDYFAASLAIGDFNNDGFGDVIAGAPLENFGKKADAGIVHVIYGSASGLNSNSDTTIHQGTTGVPGVNNAGDRFGSSVATGDFDNDGFTDAVVGAEGEDTGCKTDAGAFTILYGHRNGLRGRGAATFTAATPGVAGPAEPFANVGAAATTGDFNRDEFDDVAVGAPGSGSGTSSGAGAVHIMYGSNRGIVKADNIRLTQATNGVEGDREAHDAFGSSLAVGDFNNDRRDDLAVGTPGQRHNNNAGAGATQIFDGSHKGIPPARNVIITQTSGDLFNGAAQDDRFGTSLAAGDSNGDGSDDLAVGSPGDSVRNRRAAGRIHVLYGSDSGLKLTGTDSYSQRTSGVKSKPEAGDEFGRTLAAGNFNGNKRVDLAIGVPGEGIGSKNGSGAVHVLFGGSAGMQPKTHQWYWPGKGAIPGTPMANGGFARALATGDINGDGRDDLVARAPGQVVGSKANTGTLVLIFG